MTVEEIEIIVTAKVEEALKEFMKIVPAIKEQMQKAQEAFSKVDVKAMQNKVHQAVNFMKKKIQDFKKSTENNKVAIRVTNEDAKKQISQVQKQIDSLQEKINARQMKLNLITPKLDEITAKTTKEVTPDGVKSDNPAIQETINNSLSSNKDYARLSTQEEKLVQEITFYNKQLDIAKMKMSELSEKVNQTATSQNKLTSFFSVFKQKIEQVKPMIGNIKNIFSYIPKITQNITNHIKGIGKGIKQGLGHVLKYAGALFSLRGIYSVLSNSAQSWLSSQNSGAQQLSANIEYLKYSMGSVFAPVIQTVINLVYQLMKAIQSLVYAFSGVNIFAKATASSMKSTSNSAKQTSKALSGIHSEINNVSESKDNASGGEISPNMDLSQVDEQMNSLSQKLYDFFKPLVDSWNTYGTGLIQQIKTTASQIGGLISSVWGSFENIITNGTVYSILENILAIIGNIAEAFSNAWNYNGNGDAIVQNLADAFNNLLGAINNVVKNESFQKWLKNCSEKFREITEKLSEINWQPLVDALMQIGTTIGTIALDILSGLVDILKWLVENPIVAEILLAIAIAIGIVATAISIFTTAMEIYNTVIPIATAVSTAFSISIGWLIAIIVAIIAVIALVVLAIMNWDTIIKALKDTWDWICEQAQIIWNAIADFFKNLWQGICDTATNIWNGICEFFKSIWDWIANIASSVWNGIINTISNVINGIKNTITGVLNAISSIWNNIWTGIGNVISNIWNGIWGCIKGVINSILSGIEGMVNGVIRGVNWILGGISDIANAVGSLIGLNPINLRLSYVSLPRLAKGGVLTEATALIAGEYSGAKSNPEIVTPQNIMYDTMLRAISDSDMGNSDSDRPIYLNVYVGNKKIGEILIDDLKDRTRRTGKDIEALVN